MRAVSSAGGGGGDPAVTNANYGGTYDLCLIPSGGTNLGPNSPELTTTVEQRRAQLAARDGVPASDVPADLPPGLEARFAGITPLRTPNSDFYRVDTRLTRPVIDPDDWSLTIDGDVDRQVTLSLDDLFAMEVVECDIAIVLDDTLFGDPVRNGLKPGATVIVNTTRDKAEFAIEGCNVVAVDATGLALEILGRPITNVPLLGALIAATGITSVEAVEAAIDNQLAPKLREKNKKLLKKTYEVVKEGL